MTRLATASADGMPRVVPICPAIDGDRILIATDTGSSKLRNLEIPLERVYSEGF